MPSLVGLSLSLSLVRMPGCFGFDQTHPTAHPTAESSKEDRKRRRKGLGEGSFVGDIDD
jgi:hypothetical protein